VCGVLWMNVFLSSAVNAANTANTLNTENGQFTATSAEEESYWYSRYNLGNLVMRSWMWERYMPEKAMVIKALMMVDADFNKEEFMKWNDNYGDGDHPRPPKNPFLIKSVYKSGDPHYITKFNPNDFATQKWDQSKMDKTLTAEAFAYTIQKEVEWAKDFHGEGHFGKITDNRWAYWRFVGMMMNMNAKMQAKYMSEHMEEINKNLTVKWHFALLWAISDLASMMNDDTFEANSTNRYKDPMAGKMFLAKADMMFKNGSMMWMNPSNIIEYGTAIKGLVWYAKATKTNKKAALQKIIDYSNKLVDLKWKDVGEEAYRLAWLIEAYRVTWVNSEVTKKSSQDFLDNFDTETNLFKNKNTYTIDEVWTIIWTLNEVKLFVVVDKEQVENIFRDFFENVVNKSGLLQSAPPIPVSKSKWEYEGEPQNYFRYPGSVVPPMAGWDYWIAPVFATEVSFQNWEWKVTNSNFDTAWAMHTSNEMIWLHNDELNGFPKLYKINSADKKLLWKIEKIVSKFDSKKKAMISKRIQNIYKKYWTNSKLVVLLKNIEEMLK